MAKVSVNTEELQQLGKDIIKAKTVMLGRLAERGRKHLADEVPYRTGNLRQGVGAPDIDNLKLIATLTVSARSAATGGGTAEVFNAKGERKKTVSLRPSPAFNYAEAVAKGRPSIRPKTARALLIPVPSAPSGEGYLLIGGQVYIVRRSAAATKPNPFDERAAVKLEGEAEGIGLKVLEEFV